MSRARQSHTHEWSEWQVMKLRGQRVETRLREQSSSVSYGCPRSESWDNVVVSNDTVVSVRCCLECGARESC